MDSNKIVYLLDRVIGSKGQKLKKQNEYMYWSPFVSHHKPKLQINIITGKWHCWVSNAGGHNLFQLFKKLNIWSSLEQAEENSGDYPPVLIFKRNRSKTYVVVELEEFIKFIKK